MNISRKMRRQNNSSRYAIPKNVLSPWLNEEDFAACKCSLCGVQINNIHDSNNPYPLGNWTFAATENVKERPERCCTNCSTTKVLPARLKMVGSVRGHQKFVWERKRANLRLDKIIKRYVKQEAA